MPTRRLASAALCSALATLALYGSAASAADGSGRHDLLVFASVAAGQAFGLSSTEEVEREDFLPTADLLYTYNDNRFRVLAEYLLTSQEHDLERFQVGWQVGDQAMIWLGRFHQPGTVWNTEYHHGQYMQTSISRPGFEQWEDDGGILPAHSTGILFESSHSLAGGSELEYALSAGTGEVFDGTHLEPFDLLDPKGNYRPAYAFRLAYLPDALGHSKFGLLGDRNTVEVDDEDSGTVHHNIVLERVGLFADWDAGRWRILPTFYAVQAHLRDAADRTAHFQASYLQIEYNFRPEWLTFVRAEEISNRHDAYLQLFPELVPSRRVLGLRRDFARRHAITLEYSESEMPNADFSELRLQWSAVFP